MKAGDLVRFKPPYYFPEYEPPEIRTPEDRYKGAANEIVGLLIEYHTWEKMATILYKGEIFRIQGAHVTKAGSESEEPE